MRRIDYLPPVIAGPYQEHLTYLHPEEPEQPFLAVLSSYDFAGETVASLTREVTYLRETVAHLRAAVHAGASRPAVRAVPDPVEPVAV